MTSVLFVVNGLDSLTVEQTTAALLQTAATRGHEVHVAAGTDLCLSPDGVLAWARTFAPGDSLANSLAALRAQPPVALPLAQVDAVWVRTNPGRADTDLAPVLELLLQAEDQGVRVLNAPAGLQRAASKLFLGSLPAHTVPATYAAQTADQAAHALHALGGHAVIKPCTGTRGQGTQQVRADDPNLQATLTTATQDGPVLVQAYLAAAPQGDVRVHVVNGEVLAATDAQGAVQHALIRRVPQHGEWRSNVALGAKPTGTSWTPALHAIVEATRPVLQRHGLWHVGLDVVGDRIVECNVFSPGGLGDAGRFTGADFTGALVQAFEAALHATLSD